MSPRKWRDRTRRQKPVIRTLPPLSVLSLLLLILPGCVATPVSPRVSGKAATPSPPPAPSQAAVPRTKGPSPSPAPLFPSASPCGSVIVSASGARLEFVMSGTGSLKKNPSRERLLALARQDALARLDRCARLDARLSGFYDRTYLPDARDPALISRMIRKALAPLPRYRIVSEDCQENGDRQSCQVTLEGTLRIFRQDSRFRILSAGPGRAGPFREGEALQLRLSLTKSGWIWIFDVDRKEGATLLFPGAPFPDEKNGIPAGKSLVFPPETQTAIRLVAALPPGTTKRIAHLWVVALRRPDWPELAAIGEKKPEGDGRISTEHFLAGILPSIGTSTPPGGWSLRVIPYEVLSKRGNPPPKKNTVGP